jgi:hypothetical protein
MNGCLVEMYIGEGDFDGAMKYAENTKQDCILRVYPDGKLKIIDLIQDNEIDTTVNEFIGYNEEAAQPTAEELGFRRM